MIATDGMDSRPPDTVLSALADPTRRALLDALASRGEATATEVAPEFPVTRQAVVKHLGVLDDAGLVRARRVGREVRYRVRAEPVRVTARWLQEVAAEWDRALLAIKEIAEEG